MEKFRNHYRVVVKNSNRTESGDGKYSRGSGLWSSGEEFKLYDASEGEKPKPGFDIEDIVIEEVEGRLGLSMHKVDDILRRAELRTNQLYSHLVHRRGDIHYNAFLGKETL